MKNLLYILVTFLYSTTLVSQSLNYTDLGIMFSTENNTGTARFTGLNGSMGAIGGNLSAINVNPAGAAVFNQGEFNMTLSSTNYNNRTNYYNTITNNQSSDFSFNQIGGVFVFDDIDTNNGWKKVGLGINFQKTNSFHTQNSFQGNSGYATFNRHPNAPGYDPKPSLDTSEHFENSQSQSFYNLMNGEISKMTFSLAGQYEDNIYLGFGLNFYDLTFSQSIELNELNKDDSGNTLDALLRQKNRQLSEGFSINAGVIFKLSQQFRLGFSAESPTWYNTIYEEYDSEEFIANIPSKNIDAADPVTESSYFEYQLKTPSKLTASAAVVISKLGFLNVDYTYKTYSTIGNNDDISFKDDNQYFTNTLQNTHNINIGGELKLKNLSLRGGAGYEQSPFKTDIDPRNIDVIRLGNKYSGSLGFGMRFGASNIDIAYRRSLQNNDYDFYDQSENVNTATIKNEDSKIVATYTYSF